MKDIDSKDDIYTTSIPWGYVIVPVMKWGTVFSLAIIGVNAINLVGRRDPNTGALLVLALLVTGAIWGFKRGRGDHLKKSDTPKGTHDTLPNNSQINKDF